MNDEKMRAEFEDWLCGFLNEADRDEIVSARRTEDNGETVYWFEGDDDSSLGITAMWVGWQASRAALVVELPKQYDIGGLACDAHDRAVALCSDAVESAGVRVKP